MPAPATFLLSFDCEGKWGLVDCLSPRHQELFTSERLQATYERLAEMLRVYRIDATFAFTSAFCMTPEAFGRLRPEVERLGAPLWSGRALQAIDRDGADGWFAPACFEEVCGAGPHEIASHGFSHLPWQSPFANREVLAAELDLCRSIPEFAADKVRTFVYPRNQVAHQDLLLERGFSAYRKARASSRLLNLANEFDLQTRSEVFGALEGPLTDVPAGHFLNWRHGLRRGVPLALTVRRWKNMLRHATFSGGLVHAWTHPENFLDGHEMFRMLEEILRFVAEERDAGRLQVLTISGYAALARPHAAAAQQRRTPTFESAPVVSIGMPVLDGGAAVHVAVRSLLAQTFANWELLLIDDGSTDGQTDAVAALGDPRIRFVKDGLNRGLSARLNEAIDMARGRYFARMDHDDICHPDRLRRQVAALDANPAIDLLATRCIRVSDAVRFTGYMPFAERHEDICRRPWLRIPMTHPSWMGRVEWFRRFRYPVPAPYYAEDFELLLRACGSSRFAALPDVLLAYRVRDRVDFAKSFRARKTQYALQRKFLDQAHSRGGAMLASAALVLRLAHDACRATLQWAGLAPAPHTDVEPAHAAQWATILRQAGLEPSSEPQRPGRTPGTRVRPSRSR
jgi:peptidoglycan/xylan/chitin deacetylase (PgdA/CDA1 family)